MESSAPPEYIQTDTFKHIISSQPPDVILRSAEGTDFPVHKAFLARSSPVFDNMFSAPPSLPLTILDSPHPIQEPESTSALHVVGFFEDARTLYRLILSIYHMDDSTYNSELELIEMTKVTIAAQKYQMDAVLSSLYATTFKLYAKQEPICLYALACFCGFQDEAKQVAKIVILNPLPQPGGTSQLIIRELGMMSGLHYQYLLQYYVNVVDALSSMLSNYQWILAGVPERGTDKGGYSWYPVDSTQYPGWLSCDKCEFVCVDGEEFYFQFEGPIEGPVTCWWKQYMDSVLQEVKCHRLGSLDSFATAPSVVTKPTLAIARCTKCRSDGVTLKAFLAFTQYLQLAMERRTNAVRLYLRFKSFSIVLITDITQGGA
jgi:hypothetical protein